MDASHIFVGALTAITFGLLIWIEIRSRRNRDAQTEPESPPTLSETSAPAKKASEIVAHHWPE
jgi:hypothetical protein